MTNLTCRIVMNYGDYLGVTDLANKKKYFCDKALFHAVRPDAHPEIGEVVSIECTLLENKIQRIEKYKFVAHHSFVPPTDYPNHYQ